MISWTSKAWAEFIEYSGKDRKTIKKIIRLLEDIERNGNDGIGKPEPLTGNLSGYWSRRIDKKNRLVYRIKDGDIQIVQCGTHYGDS